MRKPLIFITRWLLSLLALVGGLSAACAQPRALDVPYVPTPENIVEAMLRLAKPGPSDFLIDLGCGDGRIPITAAKRYGARALGVDLNPVRIIEAKANAEVAGVSDKVEFLVGDLFEMDFSRATIISLYLLPQINMELRKQILSMRAGTRIVSHAFDFEDWEPDAREVHENRKVFYWMVPAKVAGWWSGTAGGAEIEVELRQSFQKLSGVSRSGEVRAPIVGGHMHGYEVTFEFTTSVGQKRQVKGTLEGASIRGAEVLLKRT